jgi:hypothetical protein
MVPVNTLAGQGGIGQMREILSTFGEFIQHLMESLDRELFLRGWRGGPVSAQDLKGDRFWLDSTPSGFRRVHG